MATRSARQNCTSCSGIASPSRPTLRNWRWPTLAAVMSGRKPEPHFAVVREGDNPIDLSLVNEGETDEDVPGVVVASWSGAS